MSKDIDGKPFYDSLRRIMVEAYSYAKKGSKDSGRSVITGIVVIKRHRLVPIFLAPSVEVFAKTCERDSS